MEIEPGIVKSVSKEELDMTQIPMDDKKCLNQLNNLDVFGIFQFETRVAIGVINEIGIDTFKDMYAATTLGRPDPLSGNLHVIYGRRKRNEEYWESIPVMADVLDQSMGLPIFQESAMLLARRLAGFSGSEANALRKGLAKGKDNEDSMKKLKSLLEEFKERAKESVEKGLVSSEQLESFVQTLEKYGGYGFNKCLSPETVVETENGLKLLSELKIGDNIKAPSTDFSENEFVSVVDIIDSGKKELFEIELESGQKIKATMEHKFLCNDGNIHSLFEIIENNYEIMCDNS